MTQSTSSQEIIAHLTPYSLYPSQAWLQNFIASQRIAVPIAALKQTAYFRLLHSDFTISLSLPPLGVFPHSVLDAALPERRLRGPIPVQVLDIDDMGRSRWSQVEAIEAVERGETTKGREIIRIVAGEDNDDEGDGAAGQGGSTMTVRDASVGPHKLLLQDGNGQKVYGLELMPVKGVSLNMGIGSKLVLKDVSVARGVLLLDPKSVTFLGGKIDDLNTKWKVTRKQQLTVATGPPLKSPT